ncbi:MAG: hypothetical protein FWB86_13675 [Treponema sp.]|nr:hypothetical protein [Treponema sp.]
MKKFILIAALITFIGAGTAFAEFGIGVHGGFGGIGGGGGLNLAFSNVFVYIDAVGLGNNNMNFSGAVDFLRLYDTSFAKSFNFYIRLGICASFWGSNDYLGLAAGVRIPIGLSWRPIPLIELFLQVLPQISLQILPSIDLWGNFWGGNLGIRLWF